MKNVFLIAVSILFIAIAYSQDVKEFYSANTNLSKDDCWKRINQWAVNGFYLYQTEVSYEDKANGQIEIKGRYNPEIDGMISTSYKQLVPQIKFKLKITCEANSYTVTFIDFYYTFNAGTVSALEIKNNAVLEASTAEMNVISHAGNRFVYNDQLKQYLDYTSLIMSDAQKKANDRTLKRKDRKGNQILYDSYSVDFRVKGKAFNDMKILANHILRELSVYLQ